jgi:hypothetical protein
MTDQPVTEAELNDQLRYLNELMRVELMQYPVGTEESEEAARLREEIGKVQEQLDALEEPVTEPPPA